MKAWGLCSGSSPISLAPSLYTPQAGTLLKSEAIWTFGRARASGCEVVGAFTNPLDCTASLFHPLNYGCLNVQNVCCVSWILHPQILSYRRPRALPLSPAASNLASGCKSANFWEASVEKLLPPPLSPSWWYPGVGRSWILTLTKVALCKSFYPRKFACSTSPSPKPKTNSTAWTPFELEVWTVWKKRSCTGTEPLADGCWALPKQLPAGWAEMKFGEKIKMNTHISNIQLS